MSLRCRCGIRHDERSLDTLPLVFVLEGRDLTGIVLHWPRGARVEVRACTCGRELARLCRGAHAA